MTHKQYLTEAFTEAFRGIHENLGGPFGAVVVKNGEIIGRGCNRVIFENDPTAHAEVTAIRDACKVLGSYDLSGTVIYSTCEPCPMCLSAIYWSKIEAVYYSLTRFDAEEIGFSDRRIYEEFDKKPEERSLKMHLVDHPDAKALFAEWSENPNKVLY